MWDREGWTGEVPCPHNNLTPPPPPPPPPPPKKKKKRQGLGEGLGFAEEKRVRVRGGGVK